MPRGFFVTFEGLDGSGKTTQLERLAARLRSAGRDMITLRQPGGTPLGLRIRSLLVDSKSEAATGAVAPMAELALMFADRAQAIEKTIKPALAAGKIVLCDRYTDSSEAYQGSGRQLGAEVVRKLHALVCQGLDPDLTFLLMPSLRSSLQRARRRNQRSLERTGANENRFETESDEFYGRVYDAYAGIAEREAQRVVTIKDDAGIDAIEARIALVLDQRIAAAVQTV